MIAARLVADVSCDPVNMARKRATRLWCGSTAGLASIALKTNSSAARITGGMAASGAGSLAHRRKDSLRFGWLAAYPVRFEGSSIQFDVEFISLVSTDEGQFQRCPFRTDAQRQTFEFERKAPDAGGPGREQLRHRQ